MMNRCIVVIIGIVVLQTSNAQKVEFAINVDGTASFFRGNSTANTTTMYISDAPGAVPNITENYYGKKSGLGASTGITVQRLSSKGFIAGISTNYEVLKSKVDITEVASRLRTPATGSTKLTHTFINLYPYIGKRFGKNKFVIDINLGLDVGLPLSAHEKGEAQANNSTVFTTDTDHSKPSVDVRPRLQLKLIKNHFGVQTSYSLGLTEYYGKTVGSDPEAYSNVFRLGLFYTL